MPANPIRHAAWSYGSVPVEVPALRFRAQRQLPEASHPARLQTRCASALSRPTREKTSGGCEFQGERQMYDIYYIKHRSLSLDIDIFFKTLKVLILEMEYRDFKRSG